MAVLTKIMINLVFQVRNKENIENQGDSEDLKTK